MKHHIWKIFSFSGWFITLIGIIFALLYASISFSAEIYGSGLLLIMGIILVMVGESLLSNAEYKRYNMIWQALSIGGAFAITIGLIWLIIQFLTLYNSWFGIAVLLAIGVGLILVGESVKFEK